jgi:ribosomal protein S18 acetylase RimI-like enzyme
MITTRLKGCAVTGAPFSSDENNSYSEANMKIDYGKAQPSDFEEIYTVMQASARELSRKAYSDQLIDTFDKFYIDKTPDYIKQTLENQHSYTIVAKDNNKIIGFIQLKVHDRIGNVSHLYILPGYNGNSIGTHLFGLIKERATQLNIAKLDIESTLNALGYYEKLGFINKGLIPDGSAYELELELKK